VQAAPHAVRLDHQPHVEDLLQVLLRHAAHVGAAVRLQRHEAFGLEDAQGLAHGRAAQRQLARELRLVEVRPRGEIAADDRLPQVARGLHGERGRLLEGGRAPQRRARHSA